MHASTRLWLPGGMRSPFLEGGAAALEAALDAATGDIVSTLANETLAASWTGCYEHPDGDAYDTMVHDEERASLYERALRDRLKGHEGQRLTVLDIGTGPYALLAIMAARAGAKHVYAVEANPKAAQSARACVALTTDVASAITIIDGLSTAVTLPAKADLLVAEIVGSVSSEEGLLTTMRDAQMRHLKRPYDASSYIPVSVATLAAPAAFALHHVLAPPAVDWYDGLKGRPVRCESGEAESGLQLLAKPQPVEHIAFHRSLPEPGRWDATPAHEPLIFELCGDCIANSEACYASVLAMERVPMARAAPLAYAMARSLSGLALWPRIQLDEAGELFIDARELRGSHWQTVLPLLAPRPMRVAVGDMLHSVSLTITVPHAVDEPINYSLAGILEHRAAEQPEAFTLETIATILTRHDDDDDEVDSDEDDDGMVYSQPFPPSPTGRRLRPVVVPL